jgi:hypothetical protein
VRVATRQGTGAHVGHQLFDLERDPHELDDVAALEPELVERLAGELDAAVAAYGARGRALAAPDDEGQRLDASRLDDLRGLGYAGGSDDEE